MKIREDHKKRDFVDLGSSKNRKEVQETGATSQISNVCQISNAIEFEKKWFGFLAN